MSRCGGNNNKYTVRLHEGNNVVTFPLAIGYSEYHAFCCETGMLEESDDDVIALLA
jgi:hypothetical protein